MKLRRGEDRYKAQSIWGRLTRGERYARVCVRCGFELGGSEEGEEGEGEDRREPRTGQRSMHGVITGAPPRGAGEVKRSGGSIESEHDGDDFKPGQDTSASAVRYGARKGSS